MKVKHPWVEKFNPNADFVSYISDIIDSTHKGEALQLVFVTLPSNIKAENKPRYAILVFKTLFALTLACTVGPNLKLMFSMLAKFPRNMFAPSMTLFLLLFALPFITLLPQDSDWKRCPG